MRPPLGRWALALALAAAAGTLGAAASGLASWLSRTSAEHWARAAAAGRAADVERALEDCADEVRTTLERLPVAPPEEVAGGVLEAARRLNRRAGLDTLLLLDASDRIVSAEPWPERAGLAEPGLPAHGWSVGRIRSAEGSRLGVLVRRPVHGAGPVASLVGGRRLDERFLRRIGAGGPAALLDFDASSTAALTLAGDPALDLRALADGGTDAPGRSGRLVRSPSGDWIVVRRDLGAPQGGAKAGAVLFAVGLPPASPARGGPAALPAAVGALGALAGAVAGLWLAGRQQRPVRGLVRAVDAIAAGEADYTFPQRPGDELESLREAFSRLQRSLDEQRERAVAAERVAVWREVARHVAHEVKNPLVPIRLTVENLLRSRRRDPAAFDGSFEAGARTILEEVDQLTRLVGEFAEFARLPAPVLRPVDVDDLVDGVCELFRAEPELELVRERGAAGGIVQLDGEQMARALKNVVGNAVEALREAPPAGRRLEVRTSASADALEIAVADRGPGFARDAVERAFEPYFTTKSGGTGLGMAIAGRIVTEHGGRIHAENREGGGARVVIRLPRRSAADGERGRS